MTDLGKDNVAMGYECPNVASVEQGPKLAVIKDDNRRPPSELRIYFINLADRLWEACTPRKPSLAELNARAALPPKGTKVETLVQPLPADCELGANYSLLPRVK